MIPTKKLYDGVDVRLLSDQQLLDEYKIINTEDYDPFYANKLGYLWFRVREISYELERRNIEAEQPASFIGKPKHRFGYWVPSFDQQKRSKARAQITMQDDHTKYGRPINDNHRQQLEVLF